MPIITIFSGTFCKEQSVVTKLLSETGYRLVTDKEIIARASALSGMGEDKLRRAFSAKTSVFNKFTHEKERSIADLRLALAEILSNNRLLIVGFVSQLIPKEISHVLRVCLIADMGSRTALGAKEKGMSEKEAVKLIHREDEDRAAWVYSVHKRKDPWNATLYDIVIPTDKMMEEEAISLIGETLNKDVLKPTFQSKKAVEDFLLASKVEVALAKEGHDVTVKANKGAVTLTVNKHVLMLSRLEEELKAIATRVAGVNQVMTKVGAEFYQTDIYRKYDFEAPSKLLLVDDEREFVQTLSERLLLRDMGSAVAYDGESALKLIKEDEPEVMILDLKMPGIDGIEVLRRVKDSNPDIEVIILTGHGSDADREVCMQLGAFAYLQKPVDIDILSETLRKANEKIKQKMETRK
jgi:CheY-like chemotaxis protein